MNLNDRPDIMGSGDTLKASDFPMNWSGNVQIREITEQAFPANERGPAETRLILLFVGKEKGLVLNKTNTRILMTAWGPETDLWKSHTIELRVTLKGNNLAGFDVFPKSEAQPQSQAPMRHDDPRAQPDPVQPPGDDFPDPAHPQAGAVAFDDDIPF
ncbi:MAG: hypothetical protein GY758_00955 [Fuerstiella sp.]|nr:hypothetical protein [Fuerstiella sp.]